MRKYDLTTKSIVVNNKKLFRIKALIDFSNVKAGDLGGYIEKEENLGHDGNAWVYDDSKVYGGAKVCGNAKVSGGARVCGNAWVSGGSRVCGHVEVSDDAYICGNARVCSDSDYTVINRFSTEFKTITFFRCSDGFVRMRCGCFYGTIDEFRALVKDTRTGKIAEEYLMMTDLMELHFKDEQGDI